METLVEVWQNSKKLLKRKWHTRLLPRVPLFCSYHILTSSVLHYWTDARQQEIYLLNKHDFEPISAHISLGYFLNTYRRRSIIYCLNRPFPSSLVPLFQSESKCETILVKLTLIYMKMKLYAELIFIWKVSHLDSFWNRDTRELGNGLVIFASFYLQENRVES